MPRLPKPGELQWASIMEEFLMQSLDKNGTLHGGETNPHTGKPNSNLANNEKAGLVQLAGDLSDTASSPKVAGLQGQPLSPKKPKHGQVLAWNDTTGSWEPTNPVGLSAHEVHARAMQMNSMRIL